MVGKEESFLLEKFQNYYRKNFVSEPPSISQREFGIGTFENKIAKRHLYFKNKEDFNYFLRNQTPFFVSYSNAYYEFPERRPMEAKNFLQADLVYEFDADDIPTACKEKHDSWNCEKCGTRGKGSIEKCTNCGSHTSVQQFFCSECLEAAKEQVFRLIDFLGGDFNFNNGISINFSGRAGYHVHMRSEDLRGLSQSARVELLDYLTANEINLAMHGFAKQEKMLLSPKPASAFGWGKRVSAEMQRLLEEGDSEKISSIAGLSHKKVEEFLKQKDKLIESMGKGKFFAFPGRKNEQFWNSLLEYAVSNLALKIDRQTSIDIARILRVPDTIHGGSGLIAKKVSQDELKNFNPLEDALAFGKEPVKVFIKDAPKFDLGKESFGPYSKTMTELPLFAAVYLIAGKRAVLAEVG